MLTNCRVVLVRPHYAGNLGATARAMRNFGLSDLVLVEPIADRFAPEARRMSTHGEAILDAARVVTSLDEALVDCRVVLATSSNIDGLFRTHTYGRPDEVIPRLAQALPEGPCALVFGPEPSGLTNVEVARCHGLIRILTDPDYAALNLAQAVAICLCELRHQWLLAQDTANQPTHKIAPFEEQERMFEHLREALSAVHFLFGAKSEQLMHAIRQLITRAQPSPNEVKILHGLARQLLFVTEHGVKAEWSEPEA
ncbi:MAG: RNA methyltransferase [Planctomycetes bacterium]|nr:RNA methyltransferase [Planctomycetota bacterium]